MYCSLGKGANILYFYLKGIFVNKFVTFGLWELRQEITGSYSICWL